MISNGNEYLSISIIFKMCTLHFPDTGAPVIILVLAAWCDEGVATLTLVLDVVLPTLLLPTPPPKVLILL